MRHAAIIMIAGLKLRVSDGFFITKAFGANGCQKIRSRDRRIKGVKIHKLGLDKQANIHTHIKQQDVRMGGMGAHIGAPTRHMP